MEPSHRLSNSSSQKLTQMGSSFLNLAMLQSPRVRTDRVETSTRNLMPNAKPPTTSGPHSNRLF